MANYVDLVGDYIPLVSGSDISPSDKIKLTPTETKDFDATFEHVARMINRFGPANIIDNKHYDLAKHVCEVVKARMGGMNFTGDGTGGFGMRAIIPEDIYSNANDHCWELGNALVPTNWIVGNVAFRYSRNDHGNSQRDTTTFQAGLSAITRDGNNDVWYTLHWGIMDQMATGLPQGVFYALNNRPRAFKDISLQMSNTEMAYAELGYGVLYEPTVPFRSGLQFKQIDAATAARVLAQVAMRPVGVTFHTQRRALSDGTITRPAAA